MRFTIKFSEGCLCGTMKEACEQVGIIYETLRFYCNEGLVPNVERDKNNYRDFDERNINWLNGLQCLEKCGMSIKDMKRYIESPPSVKNFPWNGGSFCIQLSDDLLLRTPWRSSNISHFFHTPFT